MRNPGRVRRIEHVHIERDVHRARSLQPRIGGKVSHLDHLHSKPLRLLPLMSIDGPNPDLHQPFRQPALHNPRKRAGMRPPVPLKLVIQIRMRIKMKNRQLGILLRHRFDDRKRNRMISAQRHRPLSLPDQPTRSRLNRRERIFFLECQIPCIPIHSRGVEVDAQLCPRVRSIATERLANLRWRFGRPP